MSGAMAKPTEAIHTAETVKRIAEELRSRAAKFDEFAAAMKSDKAERLVIKSQRSLVDGLDRLTSFLEACDAALQQWKNDQGKFGADPDKKVKKGLVL